MTRPDAVGPLALRVGQSATRSKTIAEADLRAYAEITGDYNPLHFDDVFAAGTLILSAEAWTYTLRPVDEKPQPP